MRARGRVVVQGSAGGRGKVVDVSTSGVRFRLAGPAGEYRVADRLSLDLRFDGARGGWWTITGRVVRCDADGQIAICFEAVPSDFATWIDAELHAAREAEDVDHVLLVDPMPLRRIETARTLRDAGRRVSEAATPLDAIDRLGESRYNPRLAAIADTVPASIANELRAYLRREHPAIGLVRMQAVAL